MCHVLLIEDDRRVAKQLSELLIEAGAASVATVDTEGEAVSAAASQQPDVIWSDVELAHGSGPGACARIRKTLPNVPIVFMTGAPHLCAAASYAVAVIRKPAPAMRIAELFRHVVSTLHREINHAR